MSHPILASRRSPIVRLANLADNPASHKIMCAILMGQRLFIHTIRIRFAAISEPTGPMSHLTRDTILVVTSETYQRSLAHVISAPAGFRFSLSSSPSRPATLFNTVPFENCLPTFRAGTHMSAARTHLISIDRQPNAQGESLFLLCHCNINDLSKFDGLESE